ncbi:MAG: glycosyltransferase family 39 protein [Acidobacteria bacterium]|nr:glycosyltransferase family 39 protein [Acidobacteriota bacterium]
MRRAAAVLLVFAATLVLAVALQVNGGAYEAEFSETMDESAHYVTGLLVHDWIQAGMPRPVSRFYYQFTRHYSNAVIGHWPPGFYVLQAAWMLLFGVARDSMVLLMAVVQAVFVTATIWWWKRILPLPYALGCGLLLLTAPLAQVSSRSLMGEAPMALLVLAAAAAWCHYLRNGRAAASGAFGVVASMALLTKGTGIVLAPLPPLTALFTGRARWLARGAFWLPAAIVVVLCGFWYARVPGALHEEVAWLGGLLFLPERVPESLAFLTDQLTPLVAMAAVGGLALWLRDARRGEPLDPAWSVAAVMLACSILFRAVVAVWEPRHMLMSLPWMLLFAAAAVRRVATGEGAARRVVGGLCLITLLTLAVWNVARTPRKTRLGLREAAGVILESPELAGVDVLVISDLRGEGAATAEFAMRERRPGRRVLPASSVLAQTSFLGDQYQAKFRDAGSLMQFIRKQGRLAVLLDTPPHPFPHAALAREAISLHAGAWRRMPEGAGAEGKVQIWLWEGQQGHQPRAPETANRNPGI